jgi:endonuclease YncB( thermonuclease family)
VTRAHRIILPALFLILALLCPTPSLAGQYEVYRVVDGDTFVVKHGSVKLTIDMVGINAPEVSTSNNREGNPSPGRLPSTSPV